MCVSATPPQDKDDRDADPRQKREKQNRNRNEHQPAENAQVVQKWPNVVAVIKTRVNAAFVNVAVEHRSRYADKYDSEKRSSREQRDNCQHRQEHANRDSIFHCS
jgi:hypothetical protein